MLVLPAACADADNTDSAAVDAEYGGTVVVANASDLTDMNPLVAGEKFSQEVNRFMLFLPLVRHAEDLSLVPALAESWEMLGDTGWLPAAEARSFSGAVHAAAISSAPTTTTVRRKGDKCLLDIEISVQIFGAAIPGFGLQINHVSLYRVLLSRPPSNDRWIVEYGF